MNLETIRGHIPLQALSNQPRHLGLGVRSDRQRISDLLLLLAVEPWSDLTPQDPQALLEGHVPLVHHVAERSTTGDHSVEGIWPEIRQVANVGLLPDGDGLGKAMRTGELPVECQLARRGIGHEHLRSQAGQDLGEAPGTGPDLQHLAAAGDVLLEVVGVEAYLVHRGLDQAFPFAHAIFAEIARDRRRAKVRWRGHRCRC